MSLVAARREGPLTSWHLPRRPMLLADDDARHHHQAPARLPPRSRRPPGNALGGQAGTEGIHCSGGPRRGLPIELEVARCPWGRRCGRGQRLSPRLRFPLGPLDRVGLTLGRRGVAHARSPRFRPRLPLPIVHREREGHPRDRIALGLGGRQLERLAGARSFEGWDPGAQGLGGGPRRTASLPSESRSAGSRLPHRRGGPPHRRRPMRQRLRDHRRSAWATDVPSRAGRLAVFAIPLGTTRSGHAARNKVPQAGPHGNVLGGQA